MQNGQFTRTGLERINIQMKYLDSSILCIYYGYEKKKQFLSVCLREQKHWRKVHFFL